MFRQMLFAKIVPGDQEDGSALAIASAQRFAELGILQFENWADPFADASRRRAGGGRAVSARL